MDATVKKIDEIVEEEVTLLIEGKEIVCFAGVCPYQIEVGGTYPVSLTLDVFEEYDVRPADEKLPSLERGGGDFSYVITGKLMGDVLDSEIKFRDDIFSTNFAYLSGRMISVKVDRINAEFLPIEG